MRRFLILALAAIVLAVPTAQNRMTYSVVSPDNGHIALGLAIRRLTVSGTFMQALAHPDDETNALFALFTHGMGLRSSALARIDPGLLGTSGPHELRRSGSPQPSNQSALIW